MIYRLILPLETKAGKKWKSPLPGAGQVLRYVVTVFIFFYGLSCFAQNPVAAFTSDKVSGCAPLVVNFQDQSTGDPKFWNWDLGNGQLSNLKNPTGVYQIPGTYTVTLVVRNANGTHGVTKTNYITVYPSPASDFVADNTIACLPATIQFTDQSSDPVGTVNKWLWDFGDGTTSNQQNPAHTYNALGFYTVSLTVTSTTGCSAAAGKYRYIRVVSGVTPDFKTDFDSACKAPFGVDFSNQTSGPGILTYNWDFGNGNNSASANPSTTYNATGTFNVTLSALSEFGCSGSITKPVNILGATTNFNFPDSACLNNPVSFQNSSSPAPTKSIWDFGDGTGSTQTNPTKSYSAPNSYTVTLHNEYSFCKDSITKQIIVLGLPAVDFTANNLIACKGPFTVTFQDISPNAAAWQWNFGDGGTSTQQNPSHTYLQNGLYDVTLTITTAFGCSNSITKSQFIKIIKPELAVSNLPAGGCIPYPFTPIPNVTSIDGVASYTWDFGDGTTAVGMSPPHVYANVGSYDIKLVITTNGGCTDSIILVRGIKTGTRPFVDFTVDTTQSCAFGGIKFKSLATPADRWIWDFGDGTVIPFGTDSVVHSYADTGVFTVRLRVLNNGCAAEMIKPQLVRIFPPVALFRDTILNCNQRRTINFVNESKVDPSYGPITYLWQFGDPANTTSNAANPVFTYPTLGNWNVTLTVTNGSCSNSITRTIALAPEAADFTASDRTPCKNDLVTLAAIGIDENNISQFEWTISPDTPVIAGSSIQKTFTSNGSYSVQLTITDKQGCSDTKFVNNYFTVSGPTADFIPVDTGGCKNATIRFTDLSTPAATITQWRWVFGDGQSQTFTSPPFTHQFSDTGILGVQLTVIDNQGCSDVANRPNLVRITSPRADFSSSNTLFCAGGDLQFKDSSSGYITNYNWNFGDGGTSTLKDPIHAYAAGDNMYTVKLRITDTVGCQDSVIKTNYVQIKSPKPAFDVTDTTTICPPLETKFTLRAQDYESYYWDFGDGQTSQLQNPRHFYNAYGTYDAKLYVVGFGGCVDSITRQIKVNNPYTTPISYSPLEACNELNVDFNIAPPPNTKSYFHFGDQFVDSSGALTFSHFYKSPSFYSPYILLIDPLDCQVVVGGPDVIKIYGAEPFFGIDKKAFCDSGTVYFTNYTITNDTIVNSVWDFGDGTTSTVKDPIHAYNTPGTYIASLTASTTRGCTKTLYDTIKVSGTPQPIITSPDVVCVNSNIDFLGSLTVPDTSIRWSWTLGNGQTSTSQNTKTIYRTTGNPLISLEAANYLGCKRSISKNVAVVPLPNINIIADPTVLSGTGIVIPATFSSNVISYNWTPSNSLSCSNCPNPFAKPQFTTKYKVSVVDSNGCTSSRDITITVVCNEKNYFIPNTFTPNADGVNDVFYPRGSGINRIHSMRIFNRWGELVFERKDFLANEAGAGWNGTVKGKPADQDVYVYIIEIICENATVIPYRGNVALIR